MTPETVGGWLAAIVVAAIAAIGSMSAVRHQKGSRENRLIDQLQEEMAGLRSDVNGLKEERLKSIRREHLRDDYINDLRLHINNQKGPPAPPWPPNMYD